MMLSDGNGGAVSLGHRLGSGGEAEVFEVRGRADVVAKIYWRSSAERTAKLRAMLSAPPSNPTSAQGHQSICWPTSLLFDSGRINVGFLMPRVDSARSVQLFKLYNPNDRQEVAPEFTWQYLVRTAANIASVVSSIHAKGYVVGDLNESNLLVRDNALVALVDCDSMQVPKPGGKEVFRCPVGKPEFTAPELQGADFSRVDRVEAHDNFALGVLIFELLMEGTHPFSGVWRAGGDPPTIEERIRHGISPYVGSSAVVPMPGAPPIDILPPSLQRLVLNCFRGGQQLPAARPSPREWQKALMAFEAALRTCSQYHHHVYGAHLASCPWCERTKLLGGLDPFASNGRQHPLRPTQFVVGSKITASNPVTVLGPAYIAVPQPLPAPKQPSWGRYALGVLGALTVVVAFVVLMVANQLARLDSRLVSSNSTLTQNDTVSMVTTTMDWQKPNRLTIRGFGALRIGMAYMDVNTALNGQLYREPNQDNSCYYATPTVPPEGISLMFTNGGRLARIDVTSSNYLSKAGAYIGQSQDALVEMYSGKLIKSPHRYVENGYDFSLVPTDIQDSNFRMIFETDGATVTRFRAGQLPEVEFVEGCL